MRAAWASASALADNGGPPAPPPAPFPRFRLAECMARYGTDKPDLGFGMAIEPDGGTVLCPGLAARASRAEQKALGVRSQVRGPDLALLSADARELGQARLRAAGLMRAKGLALPRGELPAHQPFWVCEFPLFEQESTGGELSAVHHPFTGPLPEDAERFRQALASGRREDLLALRGNHVDLVCDGVELGGGSVRIHQADVQREVLVRVLGMAPAACEEKFGHLLEALDLGAPPHGGFAIGFDRFVALMCGAGSLNRVLAFPKSSVGTDPMTGAPCALLHDAEAVLDKLGLAAKPSAP